MGSRSRLARWLVAGAVIVVAGPATAAYGAGSATGADIQVSGSASTGSPAPGTSYTYTFQVKNAGPDTATSVTFSDPLPSATVYNYATANGSTLPCAAIGSLAGGATVSCDLGTLAKGAQATVVVSVTAPSTATTYTNAGSASTSTSDPNTANNSSSVTVQVKSSGGGGGGGANSGGVNDTTAATAGPCATLGSLSAPVGYYLTWAAIWNTFSLKSCSTSDQTVNVEVAELNQATGLVDYDVVMPVALLAGHSTSMVLDNDFAPFNTTYTITFTATDPSSGTVLSTGSVVATTPPPR